MVLIISGSDKGRMGKLIGISEAVNKGVVKVDVGRRVAGDSPYEVKVLDMKNLARALPDGPSDSQVRRHRVTPHAAGQSLILPIQPPSFDG